MTVSKISQIRLLNETDPINRTHPINRSAKLPHPDVYFSLCTLAFYFILGLVKMHGYILTGRFWAEEGVVFYEYIASRTFFEGVFFVFNGHLEFVTNLIVAASTFVDFKHAPFVTTYLSFIIQSIPVIILIVFRKEIGLTKPGLLAFLLILVGLPQASEVWANSINLHFHFAFLAAIILSVDVKDKWPNILFRGLLLLAGLSGIPANFLAPIFFISAICSGEREKWTQFGIIAATSMIQLLFIFFSDFSMSGREIELNFNLYWMAIINQQIISPLFGFNVGDHLSFLLVDALLGGKSSFMFALVCSIPIFAAFKNTISSGSRVLFSLCASSLVLAVFSMFLSLGDKTSLISSAGGGRYFYAPNALAALYFILAVVSHRKVTLYFFLAILLVSSAGRINHYIGGPSWRSEYNNATRDKSDYVGIWPGGWKMKNFAQ